MVSGRIRPEEAMQATLSSLPDEVVDSIGTVSAAGEDALAERKRKLEFLKEQEALIKVTTTYSLACLSDVDIRGTQIVVRLHLCIKVCRDYVLICAPQMNI